MAKSDWERAVMWAQSGQAPQMAVPNKPSRLKSHLSKHHGVNPDSIGDINEAHDRQHAATGQGVHRGAGKIHHHEEMTEADTQRTFAMAQARMQFNDRRGS